MAIHIQWEFVNSSNIEAIAYNENNEKLYIRFLKGSVYEYALVPQEVFNEFRIAESHGKYFINYIKGVYSYNRIDN